MSQRPKLSLTTARQAVISVLAGAVVCWLLLLAFEATGGFPPVVPWSLPITLFLLAVAVGVYSRVLPKRREQHRASSQESFMALSVGKAMVMTGAALAGAHGGARVAGRVVGRDRLRLLGVVAAVGRGRRAGLVRLSRAAGRRGEGLRRRGSRDGRIVTTARRERGRGERDGRRHEGGAEGPAGGHETTAFPPTIRMVPCSNCISSPCGPEVTSLLG